MLRETPLPQEELIHLQRHLMTLPSVEVAFVSSYDLGGPAYMNNRLARASGMEHLFVSTVGIVLRKTSDTDATIRREVNNLRPEQNPHNAPVLNIYNAADWKGFNYEVSAKDVLDFYESTAPNRAAPLAALAIDLSLDHDRNDTIDDIQQNLVERLTDSQSSDILGPDQAWIIGGSEDQQWVTQAPLNSGPFDPYEPTFGQPYTNEHIGWMLQDIADPSSRYSLIGEVLVNHVGRV